LTSEQLEASRAERLRQNGHGTLTFEEARTWIEETGLCLFLPKRQITTSVAPTFVEAVAGEHNATIDAKMIALSEELLVRLEQDGVVVRLNLLGVPSEQPDYVVATWVLPYVYALRGDRDWRRVPQLTGSRQVSPLAVQTYKVLDAKGDCTVSQLAQELESGVTEVAVMRSIAELWQQLRIIPVVEAPGKAAKWQLLRLRYQKAIAEGASTSQVTAISVLASIYLQAVIAATMEDVEMFLSTLTARSKVREVLRGLVATRQVHTISFGHAPHFYVAGTLPEFSTSPTAYASSAAGSNYFFEREEEHIAPVFHPVPPTPAQIFRIAASVASPVAAPVAEVAPAAEPSTAVEAVAEPVAVEVPAPAAKPQPVAQPVAKPEPVASPAPKAEAPKPIAPHSQHTVRTAAHKPAPSGARHTSGVAGHGHSATASHRSFPSAKPGAAQHTSAHAPAAKSTPAKPAASSHAAKPVHSVKPAAKPKFSAKPSAKPVPKSAPVHKSSLARPAVHSSRKPVMAGAKSGAKRAGVSSSRPVTKKRK